MGRLSQRCSRQWFPPDEECHIVCVCKTGTSQRSHLSCFSLEPVEKCLLGWGNTPCVLQRTRINVAPLPDSLSFFPSRKVCKASISRDAEAIIKKPLLNVEGTMCIKGIMYRPRRRCSIKPTSSLFTAASPCSSLSTHCRTSATLTLGCRLKRGELGRRGFIPVIVPSNTGGRKAFT